MNAGLFSLRGSQLVSRYKDLMRVLRDAVFKVGHNARVETLRVVDQLIHDRFTCIGIGIILNTPAYKFK